MNDWLGWRVPLGRWFESGITWLLSTLSFLWDFIREVLRAAYRELDGMLNLPPWWFVVLAGGLLCWFAANELRDRGGPAWRFALAGGGILLVIDIALWITQRSGVDLTVQAVDITSYHMVGVSRPSSLLLFLPPSWIIIILLGTLATLARGWRFGLIAVAGLLLIDLLAQWENAMHTLALVIVACGAATLLAIPVGILAARSEIASKVTKPVLDFMQTLPALIYVLLAVTFFRVGVVPGIVATIIFAMPPGIRLTELGIRQVDAEVVEAGQAFGSSPGEILRQIQLPLALPTIMAGVNQVIMLTLSMVVLAGLVGTQGLGQAVVEGITRGNIGLGIEAGVSVVILAIYLDRVTASLGARSTVARIEQAA